MSYVRKVGKEGVSRDILPSAKLARWAWAALSRCDGEGGVWAEVACDWPFRLLPDPANTGETGQRLTTPSSGVCGELHLRSRAPV